MKRVMYVLYYYSYYILHDCLPIRHRSEEVDEPLLGMIYNNNIIIIICISYDMGKRDLPDIYT